MAQARGWGSGDACSGGRIWLWGSYFSLMRFAGLFCPYLGIFKIIPSHPIHVCIAGDSPLSCTDTELGAKCSLSPNPLSPGQGWSLAQLVIPPKRDHRPPIPCCQLKAAAQGILITFIFHLCTSVSADFPTGRSGI